MVTRLFTGEFRVHGQWSLIKDLDKGETIRDNLMSVDENRVSLMEKESLSIIMGSSDASWLAKAGMEGSEYDPTGKILSRPNEGGRVEDILRATRVYACLIAGIFTCTPN